VSVLTKTPVNINLAGAFTMPFASPMIPPPPYRYRDTKTLNILFRTDPQVAQKLVPAPLQVATDRPLVLYMGHFQFVDYDAPYHEAGLLVPVACEGRPAGLFAVVLYLDKANPVVGGREVYGWPKKDAEEILFQEQRGRVVARVTRYGQQIITATFEAQQRIDPVPVRPHDTLYFLKHIPSIEKDAAPDVLKLNSMVIEPDVIKEMHTGKATLQFGASPFDAFLTSIPIGDIAYAELIVHDFTLGYGQMVIDYLAEK